MGITCVLIAYLVVFSILAVVFGLVLAALTRWYLRKVPSARSLWVSAAGFFPAVCVIYAGIWFVGYASLNEGLLDRDPGLGDGWHVQIGQGYAIDMIDVTDQGIVHTVEKDDQQGLNGPHAVSGVRRLQVTDGHLFGTQDSAANIGKQTTHEDVFFSLNTRDHSETDFHSEAELRAYAQSLGESLALEPIADVYDHDRYTWIDALAYFLLLVPPAAGFLMLILAVRRARKRAPGMPDTTEPTAA